MSDRCRAAVPEHEDAARPLVLVRSARPGRHRYRGGGGAGALSGVRPAAGQRAAAVLISVVVAGGGPGSGPGRRFGPAGSRGGLPAQHHIATRASRDVLIWLFDAQLVGHAQSLNATSGAVAAPQRVQTQGLAHSTALNAYSSQGLHQLPGKNRPDTPCMRRRLHPGRAVTAYEPPTEVASEAGYAVRSMMSLPGWPWENESTKAAGSCSNPGNTDCTASNCPELMSSASVASTSAARSM